MSKNITFRPIPASGWGFQPLEPLSQAWGVNAQGKPCRLGVLHKTYRNEPGHTPGKPIWVYAIDGKGGWAATSEISEENLKAKVLKLRQPKKTASSK